MVDVVTYLNSLEIKRLTDRYDFDYSNSTKLSKVEITKLEAKKKANKHMDDNMANKLQATFKEDQSAAMNFFKGNILKQGLKQSFMAPSKKVDDTRTLAEQKYDEDQAAKQKLLT